MRIATCQSCKKRGVWVNSATYLHIDHGYVDRELCADCFDKIGPLRDRVPPGDNPSWREDTTPWQDNAISVLEEDR